MTEATEHERIPHKEAHFTREKFIWVASHMWGNITTQSHGVFFMVFTLLISCAFWLKRYVVHFIIMFSNKYKSGMLFFSFFLFFSDVWGSSNKRIIVKYLQQSIWAAVTNYHKLGSYEQQTLETRNLRSECQQGRVRASFQVTDLYPSTVEGVSKLSGNSTNHLAKVSTPNTITFGDGDSIYEFWGDTVILWSTRSTYLIIQVAKIYFSSMFDLCLQFLAHRSPNPRNVPCVEDDKVCLCRAVPSWSAVSDSLWTRGLQPTRLLCSWDSPGKTTGLSCDFFLQGIFLTQGSNLGLPHCRQIPFHLSHQGGPKVSLVILMRWVWEHLRKRAGGRENQSGLTLSLPPHAPTPPTSVKGRGPKGRILQ